MHICSLNTLTLQQEDRLQELELALNKIKWDVIGLSEIRRNYEAITHRKSTHLFCHSAATRGLFGTGFMINKKWKDKIEEFKPVSDRIATLTLKINNQLKISVIQVHAPTAKSSIETLNEFYELLNNTVAELSKSPHYLLITGDFNAKVGSRIVGEEHVMGSHNYGQRNERGQIFIDFASSNNLKICNTFFNKKSNKKWTWLAPNGAKNEIDFTLAANMSLISDVEILNNFEFDSDHRLVRTTLNINKNLLRKNKFKRMPNMRQIYTDPHIFKEDLKHNIESILTNFNSFNSLNVQDMYNKIELSIINSTRKYNNINSSADYKTHRITEKTRELIRKRERLRKLKNKTPAEKIDWIETKKLVKKSIRVDLNQYKEEITKQILEACNSTKKLKKHLSAGSHWIQKLKNISGKITYNRSEILEIATNFYKNIYSTKSTNSAEKITSLFVESVPSFLESEITKAIQELKKEKTAGSDNIFNEMIILGEEYLVKPLLDIFNKILSSEEIPYQWKISNIILLHKKGDKENINNYRPISLLSSLYKLFSKMLLLRMQKCLEEYQPVEQAGFRSSFSTIDHIHTINQIIEKCNEYNKPLYVAVVDFEKAFDSIEHIYIFSALKDAGVPSKYINIIQNIYRESHACIKLETTSRPFPLKRGVKQGDPLSPALFSVTLEYAMKNLNWTNKGLKINGRRLNNLRFADDIIILANSADELQSMLNSLNKTCKEVGLTVNKAKTKVMTNNMKTNLISLDNSILEYVDETVYLGQIISFENRQGKEIDKRIVQGWKKFWALKDIFHGKYSKGLKSRIFNSCIIPTLSYGCQTWSLTQKQLKKLRVTQFKMERSIINAKVVDRLKLTDIRQSTGVMDLVLFCKSLKWKWAGHVMRREDGRWTREITEWLPRTKRSRGRPRTRWEDELSDICKLWRREARDREKWKILGEAHAQKWVL